MNQKSSNTENFVVENCILSYPHLFQPQQVNGQGDPKYSAKLYLDQAGAGLVWQKAQELANSHFTNGESTLATFQWPVNAAAQMNVNDAANPRLADKYVMNAKASADYPPPVVDQNRQKLMDRGQIYAGCIVAVGIRLYTYNTMGKVGIGAGLQAVMKTADGEPIAGDAVNPDALFAGVQAQAPTGQPMPGGMPAPQQQPQMPQQQPQMPQQQPQMPQQQPQMPQQQAPEGTLGMPTPPFVNQ